MTGPVPSAAEARNRWVTRLPRMYSAGLWIAGILAVLFPPVGLLVSAVLAVMARRAGFRGRAVGYLIIALVAILMLLLAVRVGVGTGHSG